MLWMSQMLLFYQYKYILFINIRIEEENQIKSHKWVKSKYVIIAHVKKINSEKIVS